MRRPLRAKKVKRKMNLINRSHLQAYLKDLVSIGIPLGAKFWWMFLTSHVVDLMEMRASSAMRKVKMIIQEIKTTEAEGLTSYTKKDQVCPLWEKNHSISWKKMTILILTPTSNTWMNFTNSLGIYSNSITLFSKVKREILKKFKTVSLDAPRQMSIN